MPTPIAGQLVPAPTPPKHAASKLRSSASGSENTDNTCSVVFDLGTTCSRACLVRNGTIEFIPFPPTLRNCDRVSDTIHSKATATFFQTQKPPHECIVSNDDDTDQTPLMLFPEIRHILELRAETGSNEHEETVRSRFPLFDSFLARYDELSVERKHAVLCHAENTYLTFLKQVHDVAEKHMINLEGCKILKLLVPVPSSWTSWVQKYHAVCLQMAWELPLDSIELMHDSEAIVNLILSRSMTQKVEDRRPKMLVVNLGAHVLSINGFCIELYGADRNKFHLFSTGNIGSAHSGIHLHAALVRAKIRGYIESKIDPISKWNEDEFYNSLCASYWHKCNGMVNGQAFVLCADSSSRDHHRILFSDEDSRKMRDRCFSDALNTLDKILHDAANDDEPGKTEVVLAGGGFRNVAFREEVEKRVIDRGFILHDSTHSGFDVTESKNVAVGAARILLQAITIDKFMQMACFAVLDTGKPGNPHPVIWSNGASITARITVSGPDRDEKFIVCYPASTATDPTNIDETPHYKFAKLPYLPRGDYVLHMEYEGSSTSDDRVIAVHIHAEGRGELQVVRYPVYYDCASRLCFRDVDKCHDRGTELQTDGGFEEPEPLCSETHETLAAKVFARAHF